MVRPIKWLKVVLTAILLVMVAMAGLGIYLHDKPKFEVFTGLTGTNFIAGQDIPFEPYMIYRGWLPINLISDHFLFIAQVYDEEGRLILDHFSGLDIFTLNGREIGDWFTLSPNSVVNGNVLLHPSLSGTYVVIVYEDDNRRQVHWSTHTINAGQTVSIPISFTFPGGQRYYYVYVADTSNAEYIYTSPIFIRQ